MPADRSIFYEVLTHEAYSRTRFAPGLEPCARVQYLSFSFYILADYLRDVFDNGKEKLLLAIFLIKTKNKIN